MEEDANREVPPQDARVVTSTSQAHRRGRSTQQLVWGVAAIVLLVIAAISWLR
jgi:hypothetical protein